MKKDNIDFPEYHIWDLKNAISEFIVPRLNEYLKKVEMGQTASIPDWVESDTTSNKSDEELRKIWISILQEMLFPFDYQMNASKYIELELKEVKERKKKGLALFAEYFEHLWD